MKMIALSLSLIALLAGCSSARDPLTFYTGTQAVATQKLKNTIVNTAINNNWNICEEAPGRLRADRTHKKWKVFADITYDRNGYSIKPNLLYTNLIEGNGKVHRAVNSLIEQLDDNIKSRIRYAGGGDLKSPRIDRCPRYESVRTSEEGLIFQAKRYTTRAFAWTASPVHLGPDSKFSVTIHHDPSVPAQLKDSMYRRMTEYLTDYKLYAQEQSADYQLTIEFINSFEHSRTSVLDFLGVVDSHRQLQVQAKVSDIFNRPICIIDVSTRVDTSGVSGLVNKSTTKTTAAIAMAILDSMHEYLLD